MESGIFRVREQYVDQDCQHWKQLCGSNPGSRQSDCRGDCGRFLPIVSYVCRKRKLRGYFPRRSGELNGRFVYERYVGFRSLRADVWVRAWNLPRLLLIRRGDRTTDIRARARSFDIRSARWCRSVDSLTSSPIPPEPSLKIPQTITPNSFEYEN